uniref:Uncharacterized protein n=1 Tax=Anguilla anguilla TaxID=7936 RepID=A0A0E9TMZ7_ANGAN
MHTGPRTLREEDYKNNFRTIKPTFYRLPVINVATFSAPYSS